MGIYTSAGSVAVLIVGRLHFWASFALCAETTTVFLNVLLVLKWLSPQDSTFHYVANGFSGVMLWVGFILYRLVLFPLWFVYYFWDIINHPVETSEPVTKYELWMYPVVAFVVLVLSIVWFVPITQGLLKALGCLGDEIDPPDESALALNERQITCDPAE